MARPFGRDLAYLAQRSAGKALKELHESPDPMTPAKALALAKIIDSLDRIQGRIRKHIATNRRKAPVAVQQVTVQPAVASSSSVLGTPSPSQGQVSSIPTGVSKGDLAGACQEQSSLPDKASKPSSVQVPPSTAKSDPDKTVPPNTQLGSRTDLPPTQPNS